MSTTNSVTDEGIKALANLPKLEVLGLRNTPNVTGRVWKHFKTLKKLRLLENENMLNGLCDLIQTSSKLDEVLLDETCPTYKLIDLLKCILTSLKVKYTHIPLLVRFSKFSIRISTMKFMEDSSYQPLFEIYKTPSFNDINEHKSDFTTYEKEHFIKQVELLLLHNKTRLNS